MPAATSLGVISRFACPSCRSRARLLSGALLSMIVSTPDGDLEGSALNYLLNPVEIDGRRSWADFTAGGVAVIDERFPSRDYFDFVVQHCEPFAGVLAKLRSDTEWPKDAQTIATLIRSAPAPAAGIDHFARLASAWILTRRIGDVVAEHGPVQSADDVRRLLNSPEVRDAAFHSGDASQLFERLAVLARGYSS